MPSEPDFELDDAQRAIVRLAGEVLDDTSADPPERTWKALGQAGLLCLAVPDRLGGAGLGVLETCLLLTEVGRRPVAVPALATLALGVLPVVRWGGREQRRELLRGVATGDAVLTAALREPSEAMPEVPGTTATVVADGPGRPLAVTGTKIGVPQAGRARRILVPVALDSGGTAVAVVDPAATGVTVRPTPTSTGEPEYTLRLDGAAAELLGEATDGRSVADLYRCATAGACALGAGALAGSLALTGAHVGSREQFGRPLAAFQAVTQRIADVYVTARALHLATLSACWRMGTGRPADADLDVAAYWLASEAPAAVRACHHLHGGLGLDTSYPLHRYSALVMDLVRFLGGAEYCLDRLGSNDVHRPH